VDRTGSSCRTGLSITLGVRDDALFGAQFDACVPACLQEQRVQITAVDDRIWKAVLAFQIAQVERGQFASVDRDPHHHPVGHDPAGFHGVQQAVVVQDAGAVGRELNTRPDLTELFRLLQDPHLQAEPGQRESGTQPADAAADDDDVRGAHDEPLYNQGPRPGDTGEGMGTSGEVGGDFG
jgi:hypothetical protein